MRRAPSPYGRAPSPFSHQHHDSKFNQHQTLPTGPAQVGPGYITYTTSTGPDGRIIYHPFKAVAASYQTPSGVVSGIQWVPAEPTSIAPSGAQHVNATGMADSGSWHGSSYTSSQKDDYKAPDWQRAEEKRRKQEEKEAKRYRDQDGRSDSEYDLRMARELDGQSSGNRDRRKSFNSGIAVPPGSVQFPAPGTTSAYPTHPTVASGYPSNPYSNYPNLSQQPPGGPSYPAGYSGHNRNPSASIPDVTRQFKDMEVDRSKEHTERARKTSGIGRPREYSTSENSHERVRTMSGNYSDRPDSYPHPPGSYASVIPFPLQKPVQPSPYPPQSHYINPSPNMRTSDISSYGTASSTGYSGSSYSSPPSRNPSDPIGRSTTPYGGPPPQVYPSGHILEGQPIINNNQPRSRAPSRAPSPNPATKPLSYMGKSPHMPVTTIPGDPKQLPAPEAFSRPLNAANSFAPFDLLKIQNMDDIYDPKYPKMPVVLSTHDIYPDDWKRCMQDLGRCWTGQLPVPGSPNVPRRSTLARDLVDLWNQSFFSHRGVELILYKGRDKRTGPHAGDSSARLPSYDDTDDSSSSSSSSSSVDSDDSNYAKRVTDAYGRPLAGQVDMQEARRRRREAKQEKKRRRKEKKARRKAKARDKTYSVYIACLPRGPPAIPYAARPGAVQGGFGSGPAVPAGYIPPGYGQPTGMQALRSHGYGGGY